jgi:hypothetical protein
MHSRTGEVWLNITRESCFFVYIIFKSFMLETNTVRGFVDYVGIPPLLAFSRQHPEAVERSQSLQQLLAFQKLTSGSDFIKLEYLKKKKLEEETRDPSRFSMGTKRVSKYAHLEASSSNQSIQSSVIRISFERRN